MAEWILSSSILIAVVALVRLVFKGRINLRLQYALWGLVLLRLLIPFNIGSSAISVSNIAAQVKQDSVVQTEFQPSQNMPSEKVEHDPVASKQPERDPAPSGVVNEGQEHISPLPGTNADGEVWGAPTVPEVQNGELNAFDGFGSMQLWINAAYILWIVGTVIVALTFAAVNLLFGFRIRRSRVPIAYAESKLPLFTTAAVDSPCLFGLIRPSIYLNPDAVQDPKFLRHSIVHETTHYRHGDHIWSMLRCVCLAIHWYNPLVWWAAFLSQRDAELACDESSIRRLGEQERQEYGHTLISMTCQKKSNIFMISTTMTDSKEGLQERIKLIARKPKMAVYTLLAVLLIAAVAVGCTFTGGKNHGSSADNETTVDTTGPTGSTQQDQINTINPTEPSVVHPLSVKRVWDSLHPDDTEKNMYFCIKEDSLGGALIEHRSDWKIYVDGEPLFDAGAEYSYCVGFYLADLTGDGVYEMCLSTGEGSGLVDQRIEIFDFETKECIYSLSDYSKHDYYLFARNGMLCVKETEFSGGNSLRTGVLVFDGTEISISWDEIPDTSYDSDSLLAGTLYYTMKEDKFCIAVLPTENSYSMESQKYIIPGNQEPLVDALEAALEHRIEKVSFDYPKGEATGWTIEYEGTSYSIYTDGTIAIEYLYQGAIPPEYGYPVYEICKKAAEEAGLLPAVRPYELTDIRSATLEWNGIHTVTDKAALDFLEMRFSNSVYQTGGAACPFDALLTLELGNGRTVQLRMATDDCAAWMTEGVGYSFKVLTEDGYKDNTEFYSIFVAELIHEAAQGDEAVFWKYFRYINWRLYAEKYGPDETLALIDKVKNMVLRDPEKYPVSTVLYAANDLDGYLSEAYASMLGDLYPVFKNEFASYYFHGAYVENGDEILDLVSFDLGVSVEDVRSELEDLNG